MLLSFIIKINVTLKISALSLKANISANVNNIPMIIIYSINL